MHLRYFLKKQQTSAELIFFGLLSIEHFPLFISNNN